MTVKEWELAADAKALIYLQFAYVKTVSAENTDSLLPDQKFRKQQYLVLKDYASRTLLKKTLLKIWFK